MSRIAHLLLLALFVGGTTLAVTGCPEEEPGPPREPQPVEPVEPREPGEEPIYPDQEQRDLETDMDRTGDELEDTGQEVEQDLERTGQDIEHEAEDIERDLDR